MKSTSVVFLSLLLVFGSFNIFGMEGGTLYIMRPKDETSNLFVRQEFNFATGQWEDEISGNDKADDWVWLEHAKRYVRVNALNHKDFRRQAHAQQRDAMQAPQAEIEPAREEKASE